MNPLLRLSALELRDRLARGALRAVELAEACLAEIERREPEIRAWKWLDGDHVLQQARALDEHRGRGRPVGPLHGLPVAVKDIIDTADIPTENGTALDAGRVPSEDAFAVARLRQAGAVIMGKTVTTELAFRAPGPTRNPHNTVHTPGGSSSGSAAAVAAGMVPLALGTQTIGSVIRPASFCGIVGFKPTYGAIPRAGVLVQAPSLDTIGVFARSVEDAALAAEVLYGQDPRDRATTLRPLPRLLETASADPPLAPTLAFVRPAGWGEIEADTLAALDELEQALGESAERVDLPPPFENAMRLHETVHMAEFAKCYHRYESRGRDRLDATTQAALDDGRRVLARDYLAARDWQDVLHDALEPLFGRFDAIVAPAAPGPAPAGLGSTGNGAFNGPWTYCGTPAVTLPLFEAGNGLPMGAQLVGPRGDDARLLRTARWLARQVSGTTGEGGEGR